MIRKKTAKYYMIVLSASLFLSQGLTALASEKEIFVTLKKDYKKCDFNLSFTEPGEFEFKAVSPNGNITDGYMTTNDKGICSVEDVPAGEWKIIISSDDATEIPKVTVEAVASNEEAESLEEEIKVTRDIVGLQKYIKDNHVVVEWSDDSCGNVNVKIINTSTQETIDSQTVKEKYFETKIPDDCDTITIEVVPATSQGIESAIQKFTLSTKLEIDATVDFPENKFVNTDVLPVIVHPTRSNNFIAICNEEVAFETGYIEEEKTIEVPVTQDGENEVKIYIVDENGNRKSVSERYTKDIIAPILEMKSEVDGTETKQESVKLEGNVSGQTSLSINGNELDVPESGVISIDYKLLEGINEIHIVAADDAGNISEYKANVTKVSNSFNVNYLYLVLAVLGIVAVSIVQKKRKRTEKNEEVTKKITKVKTSKKSKKEIKKVIETENDDERLLKEWEHMMKPREIPGWGKIAIVGVCLLILFNLILNISYVESGSMSSTFSKGDTVISNCLSYVIKDPQRGDVIIFKSDELKQLVTKRIIGMPGDKIEFKNGDVYVNDMICEEKYLDFDTETNCNKVFEVPDGEYFLLGDNREASLDSRYWDNPYIDKSNIKGKVFMSFKLPKL